MNKNWRVSIATLVSIALILFFVPLNVTGYEVRYVHPDTVEKALVSDELYFTLNFSSNYTFNNNTSFLVGTLATNPNISLLIFLRNNSTISAEKVFITNYGLWLNYYILN